MVVWEVLGGSCAEEEEWFGVDVDEDHLEELWVVADPSSRSCREVAVVCHEV